jgi:hypothetical protein
MRKYPKLDDFEKFMLLYLAGGFLHAIMRGLMSLHH